MALQVILAPKVVAKRYLFGWFVVDFVSSVPFDSITLIFTNGEASNSLLKASRALKIIRLAKLLSLLRLLRISRLLRFMQRWEDVSSYDRSYVVAAQHAHSYATELRYNVCG